MKNRATLIVVSKNRSESEIESIITQGHKIFGENRVQEILAKKHIYSRPDIKLHLIGHLQTNKIKKIVDLVDCIHSIDSLNLAQKLNEALTKRLDILIQVNTSGEKSKFGIHPSELPNLIDQIKPLKNLNLIGLMTIGPLSDDKDRIRQSFKTLKQLADQHSLKELSMGMSSDFEIAIEEGATMVRVGSAVFE